jgi:hypothetical protein
MCTGPRYPMNKPSYVLLLLFLSFFTLSCQANVRVEPAELTITVPGDFLQENTLRDITIFNDNNDTINVTWYLEHPNPPSLLRPNRTFIENLSWIHVIPLWQHIDAHANASFSIFLTIPQRNDLFDQHWETWVTFSPHTENDSDIFSQEYAIRVYIDTPAVSAQPSIPGSNAQEHDFVPLLLTAGAIITGSLLALFWFWKKKST